MDNADGPENITLAEFNRYKRQLYCLTIKGTIKITENYRLIFTYRS